MLMLLAIQAMSPAPDPSFPPVLVSQTKTATDCITNAARRLARSGDMAGDIATAALSECERPLWNIKFTATNVWPYERADAFDQELRKRLRDLAIRVAVETKAARHR